MAEILRCTDRWGRDIVLYEFTWYDKIIVDHPHMDDELDSVLNAIAEPDRVSFDARHANGENFYRFGILRQPFENLYLKIIIRFQETDADYDGKIISAFPTRHYSANREAHKWHR